MTPLSVGLCIGWGPRLCELHGFLAVAMAFLGATSTKTGEPRWADLEPGTIEKVKSHPTWLKTEAIAEGKESE
jgi:hypothetical protein